LIDALKNPGFIARSVINGKACIERHPGFAKLLKSSLAVVAMLVFVMVVTVPLELNQQLIMGACLFVVALVLRNRNWNRFEVILMITLSVLVSLRYMYWRLTETVGFESSVDAFFGWVLVLAELYTLCILLLGYLQTAWPLQRKVVHLPRDSDKWPTVDVFIPTYNEPLSIVQLTVFAAQGLDWPADKLKIYLLDDGRRPEFKVFCETAGVEYLSRDNNLHYKAGNLNAALSRTDGDFVAIFDSDHITTRSFLQLSMGWFLRDAKLAMLQTPHFFYSPDPFERNLGTFRKIPNEGDLFYGLVQDGNDLWNASFFCGSCAVLRRKPLLEVGGIAIETVTEDAHTALKLSRLGYNTAYLSIPLAAGLATEKLSVHVKQRIRWARGMAQIFRVDNPLLGRGLSVVQRLCYLNAMLHFFYGLPRLIFLTAPLGFLFFGVEMFHASALMVLAYVLPHIVLSNITNSKIQKNHRHSFWNEVYETVLAWYLVSPVLRAVFAPKSAVFTVTAKGGFVGDNYFDWKIARPHMLLLFLNVVGLAFGAVLLVKGDVSASTTLINLAWVFYNITILGASISVAFEKRNEDTNHQINAVIPASLIFSNGKSVACETHCFSTHGVGLRLPQPLHMTSGSEVKVALFRGHMEIVFPAKVVGSGSAIQLEFDQLTFDQQRQLTQMTFARADNWITTWGRSPQDQLLRALKQVFTFGLMHLGPKIYRSIDGRARKNNLPVALLPEKGRP